MARHSTYGIALAGLLLASICCACIKQPGDAGKPQATDSAALEVVHTGYNFSPQQTSNIIQNLMHEAHTNGSGIECKDCHRDENEFITHEQALALCSECHDKTVALEIWDNHCLSCHQFSKYKEHYAESTHVLNELCQGCHEEGSVIYQAFNPDSPHDITCDNCHQPHRSALVVATGVCEGCHEDVAELTTSDNSVHGSCIVCHSPHAGIPDANELCNKCHIATSNILVHNVPEHPNSCLACHQAHFTAVEITDDACLVCHDDTYYGGKSNLPRAHRDCESCHTASSFAYLGDETCANCHQPEGEVIANSDLPDQHRDCASCHKPHSWYAEFEHTCEECHDTAGVIEHRLSFHQATCHDCHDPHHTELMAPTGNCDGCHGEGTFPNFRAGLADSHLQCENCHSQVAIDSRKFDFAGFEASCRVCHSEAGDGLPWSSVPSGHQVCVACHEAHTFETSADSMHCDICHRDVFGSIPSAEHSDCFNCHTAGHDPQFSSQEQSCDICHSDVLEQTVLDVKRDCELCHAPHDFTADPQSCSACHADPPALHAQHTVAACSDCHAPHAWTADLNGCTVCHSDLPEDCNSPSCTDCHGFGEE